MTKDFQRSFAFGRSCVDMQYVLLNGKGLSGGKAEAKVRWAGYGGDRVEVLVVTELQYSIQRAALARPRRHPRLVRGYHHVACTVKNHLSRFA